MGKDAERYEKMGKDAAVLKNAVSRDVANT